MKKIYLTLTAILCCLFLTGCVSVPEKTVTFTVPDENVNFFTPEYLDAFFSRYRFASSHKYIYKTKIPWCYSWYRGNRKWYISAEIHPIINEQQQTAIKVKISFFIFSPDGLLRQSAVLPGFDCQTKPEQTDDQRKTCCILLLAVVLLQPWGVLL